LTEEIQFILSRTIPVRLKHYSRTLREILAINQKHGFPLHTHKPTRRCKGVSCHFKFLMN